MTRKLRSLTTGLLIAGVLIAGVGLVAGPVTSASADAYNDGTAYLRSPSSPSEPIDCTEREIVLAEGTYLWRLYTRWWANDALFFRRARGVWLRGGEYRWRDCISQANTPSKPRRGYLLYSRLYEKATGGGPAYLDVQLWADSGTGTYHYGSALLRTGP